MGWRTAVHRYTRFDDAYGTSQATAINANGHLLAWHPIEPLQVFWQCHCRSGFDRGHEVPFVELRGRLPRRGVEAGQVDLYAVQPSGPASRRVATLVDFPVEGLAGPIAE